MNEENKEDLDVILEMLTDMELISLHSYLRTDYTERMVRVDDVIKVDLPSDYMIDLGFELPTVQFMTYIELELNQRNLN